MRLIDADRLLSDRAKSTYYHLPNGDTAIPIIDIEHAPTIEERKKGKWIPIRISEVTGDDKKRDDPIFSHKCSVCGEWCLYDETTRDLLTNFCPNCGADMRGETDETD